MLILVEQDYLDMLNNLLLIQNMLHNLHYNLNKHFHFSKCQQDKLKHILLLIMLSFLSKFDNLFLIQSMLHMMNHMIDKHYFVRKYQLDMWEYIELSK